MKKLILLLAGVLSMSGCTGSSETTAVNPLLSRAKTALAPDRRTAVFDVTDEMRGNQLTLRGTIQSSSMRDDLIRYLKTNSSYTIVDELVTLPDSSVGMRSWGIVSISVANIRTKPEHSAEMATQALMGTPLRLLRKARGWCQVQTPDEYIGWTDDHVVEFTMEEAGRWESLPKVIVTSDLAYVRKTADSHAEVISDVVLGNLLALIVAGERWLEVALPDGRKGFLPSESATAYGPWLADAKETPERIVATAKRFLGLPYLWGGTSPRGLDCSGFTKTVYFMNGVLLPRDANQQAEVGNAIPLGAGVPNLQVGDLLFFGRKGTDGKPDRITHVGISLGGARFIHASNYVRTNSLDPADPEYAPGRARSFVQAQRIIGASEETGVRHLTGVPGYHVEETR